MKVKTVGHRLAKIAQQMLCLQGLQDRIAAPTAEIEPCEPPTEVANRAGHYLYTATTLSKRGTDWLAFADEVAHHIENYTVPQYGDAPNDQVESWTAKHCINQLHKYASRHGSNKRKDQDHLDLLKIAHYAQLAAFKLRAERAAAERAAAEQAAVDLEAVNALTKKYVGSTEALYALDVGKRVAMKGWSEHRYLQKHGDLVYEYQTNTPHGLRMQPYNIEPRTLRDAEWYILEI